MVFLGHGPHPQHWTPENALRHSNARWQQNQEAALQSRRPLAAASQRTTRSVESAARALADVGSINSCPEEVVPLVRIVDSSLVV